MTCLTPPGFIDINAFSTPCTTVPDPITVLEKSKSLSKAPPCGPPYKLRIVKSDNFKKINTVL